MGTRGRLGVGSANLSQSWDVGERSQGIGVQMRRTRQTSVPGGRNGNERESIMKTLFGILTGALVFVFAGCGASTPLRDRVPFEACSPRVSERAEVVAGGVVVYPEGAVRRGTDVVISFRIAALNRDDCRSLASILHMWNGDGMAFAVSGSNKVPLGKARKPDRDASQKFPPFYATIQMHYEPVQCGSGWQARADLYGSLAKSVEASSIRVDLKDVIAMFNEKSKAEVRSLGDSVGLIEK